MYWIISLVHWSFRLPLGKYSNYFSPSITTKVGIAIKIVQLPHKLAFEILPKVIRRLPQKISCVISCKMPVLRWFPSLWSRRVEASKSRFHVCCNWDMLNSTVECVLWSWHSFLAFPFLDAVVFVYSLHEVGRKKKANPRGLSTIFKFTSCCTPWLWLLLVLVTFQSYHFATADA